MSQLTLTLLSGGLRHINMKEKLLTIDRKTILFPVALIVLAVIMRLLPHLPNVTPLAAMALTGSLYMERKYAFILPLSALFLSDLLLGFHDTMVFVYAGFLITGVIGLWIKKKYSLKRVVSGTLLSSFIFFLLTNAGVWLVSSMYEKTFLGLMQSYTMALPFLRNSVLGDLGYTLAFVFIYNGALFLAHKKAFLLRNTV
ncbi:MAG: hypothetical protein QG600_13 [Patescibacteria group bacterium]|nr:hypothetical protein [Patescibacteria group bacterium]